MGRMVICVTTGEKGDSSELYKIGSKWFKDKNDYIEYLKRNNVCYGDILDLLISDRNIIFKEDIKNKIVKLLHDELLNRE